MTGAVACEAVVDTCPCGGGTSVRAAFSTSTRRYVRCPSCGLVFRVPRPSRDLLEAYFRDAYDDRYGAAEASDDRTPVFESVLAHVARYRAKPGSVLDIGCGEGDFLNLCRRAGWCCAGIELSQGAATRAARRGLTMLPVQALEHGAGCFDVVTLINVLETVADPLAMLRQAGQVLSEDGIVMVRATNGAFHLPLRTPARWIGSQFDQAFHWYLFTPKALSRLLEAAGLVVLGVRNSRPSRGPVSPVHPYWSRAKWTATRALSWPAAQMAYGLTGGRVVCAPSFEIAARRCRFA